MKINLKVLRDDFFQFLKGIKKENFLTKDHKLIIGCDRTHGYFYLLDQLSDSVYGHSYPLVEPVEENLLRFCEIEEFEKFVTELPPNLSKIEFGIETNDSPYYLKLKGSSPSKTLLPLFSDKEGNGELLTIAPLKSIAVDMYESLNTEDVPDELRRLFYTQSEQRHSFFALDGHKKVGFSIPSKGENLERGAIFNPGYLAFFLVPMTEKSKVKIISNDEAISWIHHTRKGTRIISSLHNKASLEILAKTKSINMSTITQSNNIKVTADAFGKLLIQHRLKFNRSKSDNSFYLWKLKVHHNLLEDLSTRIEIPILNGEEVRGEVLDFAIPLTQIDWLIQALQKGAKGEINIHAGWDSSNLIAIEFQQDTIRYEWLIPNVVNSTAHGSLKQHSNTIRDFRRRMNETKKLEPIKITIERNGDSNTFTFFPSNEGILISVDYQGIVMSALPNK